MISVPAGEYNITGLSSICFPSISRLWWFCLLFEVKFRRSFKFKYYFTYDVTWLIFNFTIKINLRVLIFRMLMIQTIFICWWNFWRHNIQIPNIYPIITSSIHIPANYINLEHKHKFQFLTHLQAYLSM